MGITTGVSASVSDGLFSVQRAVGPKSIMMESTEPNVVAKDSTRLDLREDGFRAAFVAEWVKRIAKSAYLDMLKSRVSKEPVA